MSERDELAALLDPENAPARHGEWRPARRPMGEESVELVDDDGCSLWVDPWEVAVLVNGAVDRAAGVRVAPSPTKRESVERAARSLGKAPCRRCGHIEDAHPYCCTGGGGHLFLDAREGVAPSPDAPGLREWVRHYDFCPANDTGVGCVDACGLDAALAALALPPRDALDVERLARAYAEAGYGPALTDEEWSDIAREYAAQSEEPTPTTEENK